jgi:hypothetical protein
MGHDGNAVPVCRPPAICLGSLLADAPVLSGLAKPLQVKDLKELEYVDYTCTTLGPTWSLFGEYIPGEDYLVDQNVAFFNGGLRIRCATGGVLGVVSLLTY